MKDKPVILLDTHVLYWMANDSKRLSRRARETIREARQSRGDKRRDCGRDHHTMGAGVAGAKRSNRGRCERGIVCSRNWWRESFSGRSRRRLRPWPCACQMQFPKDPADRLIAATAMVEGMPLVTADMRIRQSKVVETGVVSSLSYNVL